MFYKVLGGRWGEGYLPGDIVELDENSARDRLAAGELEEVKKPTKKNAKKVGKTKKS